MIVPAFLAVGQTEEEQQQRRRGAARAVIDDDLLDEFVVTGPWDTIASEILDRYTGTATRVVDCFGDAAWASDPSSLGRWSHVAAQLGGNDEPATDEGS